MTVTVANSEYKTIGRRVKNLEPAVVRSIIAAIAADAVECKIQEISDSPEQFDRLSEIKDAVKQPGSVMQTMIEEFVGELKNQFRQVMEQGGVQVKVRNIELEDDSLSVYDIDVLLQVVSPDEVTDN